MLMHKNSFPRGGARWPHPLSLSATRCPLYTNGLVLTFKSLTLYIKRYKPDGNINRKRDDDRSGTKCTDNFLATMRQKNQNLVEENVDEFLNRDKVQNCRGSNKKNPNSFLPCSNLYHQNPPQVLTHV